MKSRVGVSGSFPLLVCALLLLQMLSPLALAQQQNTADFSGTSDTPYAFYPYAEQHVAFDSTHSTLSSISLQSPSVSGCELKEVTPAQYRRMMDSVFQFEGKEITDRPDTSLKALPAANSSNINVNVYNFPAEESGQYMTAKQFAQLASAPAGKSVDDVLHDMEEELGVGPDEQISIAQGRAFSTKKSYPNSLQGLLNSISANKKAKPGETSIPGFEVMKVRLPTGVELPLSDLMKQPAIASRFTGGDKSCLLNDASITGKLSYRALLDKDLTIAGDRAEVAKDAEAQDKQHLNTDGFQASFQNYDGNVVVPRIYEKAVKEMKKWAYLDFILTGFTAVYSTSKLATVEKDLKKLQARKEFLQGTSVDRTKLPLKTQEVFASDYGHELDGLLTSAKNTGADKITWPGKLDSTLAAEGVAPADIGRLKTNFAAEVGIENQLEKLHSDLSTIGKGDLFPAGASKEFLQDASNKVEVTKVTSGIDKITQVDEDLLKLGATVGGGRALSSAVMGVAWLGPGRIALEVAGALFFSSVGSPDKKLGTRLVVFANNHEFARSFKEATDFLMSGRVLDLISDLTKSGVPTKVFNVDNVQLIQTMGSSGPEKQSTTALLQQDNNWIISQAWRGSSTATAFEDIRDGKAISSMAIEFNTTAWHLGLQRKKDFANFYRSIAVLSPILFWKFHVIPEVSGGVVTLLRLAVVDEYLENFVDPVSFSDKEKCNDETLDWYIDWYRNAVIASQAEQLLFFTPLGKSYLGIGKLKELVAGSKYMSGAVDIYQHTAVVDPIGMGKAALGSLALEYASTCKDSQYKIMAYQRLPEKVPASAIKKLQAKSADVVGLGDVVKGLNIGKGIETFVGNQLKAADLKEILNLKVLLNNQNGQVRPSELYEVHIEPTSQLQKTGVYGPQAGCFRNCLVNDKGKFVCLDDQKGVYDEKGVIIPDKDFSLNSYFIPKLGNVVPTKIIVAPLACGGGLFSSAPIFATARASDASLVMVDATCGTKDCLTSKLAAVTGFAGGNALSDPNWFGNLKGIHTTLGIASVHQNEFKFLYSTGIQSEGTTTGKIVGNIPLVDDGDKTISEKSGKGSSTIRRKEFSLVGVERRIAELEIVGDGSVRVKGADGSKPEELLGELRTIEFENGVIHYDPAQKRLVAIIHKLADVPAASIQTLGAQPGVSESPKASLEKEKGEVDALKNALLNGQKLSDKQQELLKQMVDKLLAKDALNAAELAKLREAMQKIAQGKPLSPEEAALLARAQQQPIFPGVAIVPQEKIDRIGDALKDGGAGDAQAAAIKSKLENQQPLTLDEKKTASTAIDSAKAAGKVSAPEAEELKKAVDSATAPSERAKELAQAIASGAPLTDAQKKLKNDLLNNVLASEQARLASEIATAPAVDIPGIKLGPVVAKPGQEDNARKLNAALNKLGTLTDFSTEKYAISFGTDSAGNAVVKIGDKEKGTFETLRITGAPTRDGNAIVFPTDKGPLRFEFNMDKDTGAPTINIAGPNINEKSPLLLAQGKDGFIWFDPTTGQWRVGPGMVIPTDELFGKTGAQFQGSADGTRGFAGDDKFTPPRISGEASVTLPSSNPLLSLPSWPENLLGVIAMLLAVLAGVLAARARKQNSRFE